MSEHDDDMEDGVTTGCDLLPAWFTARMSEDNWHFGILTVTNHVFYIQTINAVRRDASGNLWIDVELWEGANSTFADSIPNATLVAAPTSRTTATINASHIVAAVELADT